MILLWGCYWHSTWSAVAHLQARVERLFQPVHHINANSVNVPDMAMSTEEADAILAAAGINADAELAVA